MDIRFCDICNESIAKVHFDEGRAVLRDGHVCVVSSGEQGRASDRASRGGGGAEWMAAAAIVVATGLAWVALDRSERTAAELERDLTAERAQMATALSANAGVIEGLAAASAVERERLLAELDTLRAESSAGRVRIEELAAAWQGQLAGLGEAVAALEGDAQAGEAERLARVETSLTQLRGDVELLGGALIETLDRLSGSAPVDGADAGASALAGADGTDTAVLSAAVAALGDDDAMVRWDAVDQLARSGDAAAAEPLLPLLADPDLVVRMSVARALAELGNPIATPALIDALEDPEPPVREAAVVALRQLTGRSFRFDPVASESDRERKVEAWRRWWERSGTEGADAP